MPFVDFANIDYPFVPFPAQLKVERAKSVTKTRVSLLEFEPQQIFNLAPGTVPPADQLAFAEAHLEVDPTNKSLLQTYIQAGVGDQQAARVHAFLASGLDKKPVRIDWHRMVQSINPSDEQDEQLRQRYAKWLQKDPSNSAILYLRGRLEPYEAAMTDYDRAIEADRENPYPWFAKGYQLQMAGDLAGARQRSREPSRYDPSTTSFATGCSTFVWRWASSRIWNASCSRRTRRIPCSSSGICECCKS